MVRVRPSRSRGMTPATSLLTGIPPPHPPSARGPAAGRRPARRGHRARRDNPGPGPSLPARAGARGRAVDRREAAAIRHLTWWVERRPARGPSPGRQVLHAAAPGWRPDRGCRPRLEAHTSTGPHGRGRTWPVRPPRRRLVGGRPLPGRTSRRPGRADVPPRGQSPEATLDGWLATEADLGRPDLTGAGRGTPSSAAPTSPARSCRAPTCGRPISREHGSKGPTSPGRTLRRPT